MSGDHRGDVRGADAHAAPPEPVRAWVTARFGPVRRWTEHTQHHGVTRVWRGDDLWVKQHGGRRKHGKERRAYEQVVPHLAAAGFRVPALLARDDALRLVVVSHLDGIGAEAVADRADLHRQAGALLAALHGLRCPDDDPLCLAEALVARAETWLARGEGCLPAGVAERVRDAIGDGSAFAGIDRSWCHRDFSARNWLVDDRGRLGLIDFEHTQPDLWLVDLLKLVDDDWRRAPATRAAFFAERTPLPEADRDRLVRLLWLHAACTVIWSHEHDDPVYGSHGRGLLELLARGGAEGLVP